jgi:hypothetical protein
VISPIEDLFPGVYGKEVKLTLDLREIYNRGGQIEVALRESTTRRSGPRRGPSRSLP